MCESAQITKSLLAPVRNEVRMNNTQNLPTGCVFIAMSLDGYIATKDNGLDWLHIVDREGEDYGYADFTKTIDVILMGRHTYDVVAKFDKWFYEGKQVAVYTRSPITKPMADEFQVSGSMQEVFTRLGAEGAKRIYVDGGQTIRTALTACLIREMTISIIPVILGRGIRLFDEMPELQEMIKLEAGSVKKFEKGLIQLKYIL